ncbi:MAG: HypC/HybG/HupF family hydrogenase formation chaperone [Proteobacteria bacterium]|nr:HypC/HybG/HupF family hydrogenase formation chaperone [Desulfocapsa sp.]MBU3944569.1 HypC/HybG/HupF family hydrogenase formation chaperone [Pseudomonadota bacterium]MCG2744626.1 HypC/HybG/HupF family hydrogenase formation chaperone [Desulfobacteraceae bacterium]MDP3185461.1 HypC/HybG/HupF family hydrogenase formation chaperone [Anaerolineales bacterium]MBU3983187.1 HypC/HybG/HupF family hydrogenase formation chaperone [Pseudomonadota bacterium]
MCLAIPMQVIEIRGDADDFLSEQIAVVDADGIRRETRLDIVDRWPQVGDYLIIHAGFAIHTLDPDEAKINLKLMREMADGLSRTDGTEQ